MLVVAQGGVLSLVPGCSATVSAGNGQVSGTLAARSFPSAGSPVGPTVDLYAASGPADSIGYMPAGAGTQLAYPAGITVIIIIIIRLFKQLTIRNCYTTSCHAGQHKLARRPEQQGLARANAATNGTKQSRQPQPGHGLVGI